MDDTEIAKVREHLMAAVAILDGPKITSIPMPTAPKAETIEGMVIHDKYKFGDASFAKLTGVKAELVKVATLALRISVQDFTFYEGVRSLARQKEMVAQGTSKTLKGKHLVQADGFGHAMDLVPWIGGKPVWDWSGCYMIACAVDAAATHLGYADNIRWGGAWDRVLSDFGGKPELYRREVEAYKARHPGPDFIDGPHYEWVS